MRRILANICCCGRSDQPDSLCASKVHHSFHRENNKSTGKYVATLPDKVEIQSKEIKLLPGKTGSYCTSSSDSVSVLHCATRTTEIERENQQLWSQRSEIHLQCGEDEKSQQPHHKSVDSNHENRSEQLLDAPKRYIGGRLIKEGKYGGWLNCLLQILFHLKIFRNAVYKIPISSINTSDPILELQKLFRQMEYSQQPVSVHSFVCAMGWQHLVDQLHDMHEAMHELLHLIQTQAAANSSIHDDTWASETIKSVFAGSAKRMFDAIDVDYHHEYSDNINSISVGVLGLHDLKASLSGSLEDAYSDEDSKWNTGPTHGFQDVRKQYKLHKLPDVLRIRLERWYYDWKGSGKLCTNFDYHEYPTTFDVAPWMIDPEGIEESTEYQLFGVLTLDFAHTYPKCKVYVQPELQGSFYMFRNEQVEEVTIKEVMNRSFGKGTDMFEFSQQRQKSAGIGVDSIPKLSAEISYALFYVRKSRAAHVFQNEDCL